MGWPPHGCGARHRGPGPLDGLATDLEPGEEVDGQVGPPTAGARGVKMPTLGSEVDPDGRWGSATLGRASPPLQLAPSPDFPSDWFSPPTDPSPPQPPAGRVVQRLSRQAHDRAPSAPRTPTIESGDGAQLTPSVNG